jgi:hypothetical protein
MPQPNCNRVRLTPTLYEMARSRKRSPARGITSARSEKPDKLAAHRRERRAVRAKLSTDPEPEVLPHTREVSNPWSMAKDGKLYLGKRASKKDPRKIASLCAAQRAVVAGGIPKQFG